jgi:hypothetical protein
MVLSQLSVVGCFETNVDINHEIEFTLATTDN